MINNFENWNKACLQGIVSGQQKTLSDMMPFLSAYETGIFLTKALPSLKTENTERKKQQTKPNSAMLVVFIEQSPTIKIIAGAQASKQQKVKIKMKDKVNYIGGQTVYGKN